MFRILLTILTAVFVNLLVTGPQTNFNRSQKRTGRFRGKLSEYEETLFQ